MRFVKRINYIQDIQLFKYPSTAVWYFLLVVLIILAPLMLETYWISLLNMIGIYIIVSLGLNLLSGYTGQVSLGHSALFGIGAYSSAILTLSLKFSFWFALPLSGLIAAIIGVVIGLPALRLKGLYFAISTMGFGFIVEEVIIQWDDLTNGVNGLLVTRPSIGSFEFSTDESYYYIVYFLVIIMTVIFQNILRTPTGRAFIAIRDSEIAAESMGINLAAFKAKAFGISAFYTGIAGALFAHFMLFIGPENFDLMVSISFLVMILVGGMGSVHGSVFGAIFVAALPEMISLSKDYIPNIIAEQAGLQTAIYGLMLLLFIRFEPQGLYGWWFKIKFYFEHFPYYKKDTFKRVRKFYRREMQ